jgi:hypothetical protein
MPAVALALLVKLPALAWGPIKRNPIAAVLVLLLIGQQVQLWQGRRENTALRQTINAQKTEMAALRGAIQKLTDAAATLKPGETRTIYVDRPVMVQVPGQTITKEVPVVVTRTEKTIETKVEVLRIPGEKITEFVEKSPQSIVATMTALRPIAQGEKFVATFVQLQPGVWQPLVTPDSPIGIEAKVVTPVDRIPQPAPVASRFTVTLYSGYAFGATPSWISGARADYRLSPRWGLEADAAHFWRTRTQEYRLLATFTF